eukprot:gene10795-7684_t
MSYLRNFRGVPTQTEPSAVSVVASSISDPDVEAKFTHLRLNAASAQAVINAISGHVQALNLSHNRIEQLPRSIPPKVIGLNLSFNVLTTMRGAKALVNLIELNVSHNNITSLVELSACFGLQYLDVSDNHLTEVVGLESLPQLKMLKCAGNLIKSNNGFRTLSFNTQLTSLDIARNPVSEFSYQDVRVYIHNLLPGLKTLDGHPIRANQIGYTENIQPVMQQVRKNSPSATPTMMNGANGGGVSAMSSPTWSAGLSAMKTPAPASQPPVQQQSQASYFDQYQGDWAANSHSNAQNIEPNSAALAREELDELRQDLLENRFVSNSRLPWRKPPNPMPREFASRPWLTDPIRSTKSEEYDRTKSPINYFLSLRHRADERDASSVSQVPSGPGAGSTGGGGGGGASVGPRGTKRHAAAADDQRSEKSFHQFYDLNVSHLTVCHPDLPVQRHPRPRDPAQLPLLPTEVSTLNVDGRTSFAHDASVNVSASVNASAAAAAVNTTLVTAGGDVLDPATALAKSQHSFHYTNHQGPPPLRSYTKAYQRTLDTFERHRAKHPQLLPHQQPYDGVYPSPVLTPLHHQYPGFHTLRGREDDAELYAGAAEEADCHPQGQLNFGPDVSPLSAPAPHGGAGTDSATVSWMAPTLRSPALAAAGTATTPDAAMPPYDGFMQPKGASTPGAVPVWDLLDVARRWDIHEQHTPPLGGGDTGRGRSRWPGDGSGGGGGAPPSRSRSPTKASVLRAEFIRTQQAVQETLKQLEEHPPRKPRFADTYSGPGGMRREDASALDVDRSRRSDAASDADGGGGRSRSRSRSRPRSDLVGVAGDDSDAAAGARGRSPAATSRRVARSKSPYQNLLDLKARIQTLLHHEAEYYEAQQQPQQQQQPQPPREAQRRGRRTSESPPPPPPPLPPAHGTAPGGEDTDGGGREPMPSRVFDFLRGEMSALHQRTAAAAADGGEALNTSMASATPSQSSRTTRASLVMVPTVASRGLQRHPENALKAVGGVSSAVAVAAAASAHATHATHAPHATRPQSATATVSAAKRHSMASTPTATPKRPPSRSSVVGSRIKRPASPSPARRPAAGGPAAERSRRSPSPAKKPPSSSSVAVEEAEPPQQFAARMNEYLRLFEAAGEAAAAEEAPTMEQMMGAGFALYEQLVRKRSQLLQHQLTAMSPPPPGRRPSSPSPTRRATSPSSRLARESEFVLRALQRYMMDTWHVDVTQPAALATATAAAAAPAAARLRPSQTTRGRSRSPSATATRSGGGRVRRPLHATASMTDMQALASTLLPPNPPQSTATKVSASASAPTLPLRPSSSAAAASAPSAVSAAKPSPYQPQYVTAAPEPSPLPSPSPSPLPSPAMPPTVVESGPAMSVQAMAIGSLIAQVTARQKESLYQLQQQLQAPPVRSPATAASTVASTASWLSSTDAAAAAAYYPSH